MSQAAVIHSTFVVEKTYPKPPEVVFNAFADPVIMRRWFAESDHHEVEEFEADFRVGGAERLRYRLGDNTPFPGVAITNEGVYEDIVANRRLVIASRMALGDKPISVALVTVELLPVEQGTDLVCTYQGIFFEGSDGPQMREGGWRRLFDKLATELARS